MPSKYGELLQKITDAETARDVTERTAKHNVSEARAKVTALMQTFAEVERANEQQLRELRSQCDKEFRDASATAGKNVNDANRSRAACEDRAKNAEALMDRAETHTAKLQAKVDELTADLKRKEQWSEKLCTWHQKEADDIIKTVDTDGERRVAGMNQVAHETKQAATKAIDRTAGEHAKQLAYADVRAEGRNRFRELCSLSKMHDDNQITHTDYKASKQDLIELWRNTNDAFANTTAGADKAAIELRGPPEVMAFGGGRAFATQFPLTKG